MSRLNLLLRLVLLTVFFAVFAVAAVAETASFRYDVNGYTSVEDTFIMRDTGREEWNMGGSVAMTMHGQSDEYYPYKAALIKFEDIFGNGPNQVPSGQNLQSATLRLYLYYEAVGGSSGKGLIANPMLVDVPDFGISDGPALTGEVTFRDLAHGQADWGPPIDDGLIRDVDYDSSISASVSYLTADVNSFIDLDITRILLGWYESTVNNYGLFIRPNSDQTASYFRSSNYSTVSERPELVIEYFAPACGDFEHPYPVGDFSEDCYVNMEDVTLFAQYWLNCTDPYPPCNFTP